MVPGCTRGPEDEELQQLTAPSRDTEGLADVLRDPNIAGFDVTVMPNEPHHVVGQAIGEFYHRCRRDDLTLLYFTGHGLKDDQGRLYLAMSDTQHDQLLLESMAIRRYGSARCSASGHGRVVTIPAVPNLP